VTELAHTVASEFAGYFETIGAKARKWVEPLSNEQFWRNPYSHGNSVGHLLLHLTGNLNYYIGAQIAGTGYIRNRDREFTEADRPAMEQVLANFDSAIQMVIDTIRKQSPENWSAAYSAERSTEKTRFAMVLSCAAHADHHLGQIIYLSRELANHGSRSAAT
jgi:uncharacterized damage-inducible protein DinB